MDFTYTPEQEHFRAEIRQQHRAVRPGNKIAQLQNSDAVQTTFHSSLLFLIFFLTPPASSLSHFPVA